MKRYAWVVSIILLFDCVSQMWQRQMINSAYGVVPTGSHADNPKYEMSIAIPNFTETRFSYLAGFAFTMFYATSNLFFGVLSDNMSRKWLLGVCSIIWSATSVFIGVSTAYWELFLARALLGIFAAALNPAAYSIVADYFPPELQTTPNAVLTIGKYTGTSLSSLSIILIEDVGWRLSYISLGIFGAAVGLIIIIVIREPIRGSFKVSQLKPKSTE